MKQLRHRLELGLWRAAPSVLCVLLVFVAMLPFPIEGLNRVMPILALVPVFYWGLMELREIPLLTVFLVGILYDIAAGLPLGVTPLAYGIFVAALYAQRKYIHKEGFVIKWAYFALLLLVMAVAQWVILSLYFMRLMPMLPALIQWLMTVGCYPLLHVVCDRLYERIHARRWRITHGL